MGRSWRDRLDFCEVDSHDAITNMVRDKLEPAGFRVTVSRQSADGRGVLFVRDKQSDATAIRYHLPEDVERIERLLKQILSTQDRASWRDGPRVEG